MPQGRKEEFLGGKSSAMGLDVMGRMLQKGSASERDGGMRVNWEGKGGLK